MQQTATIQQLLSSSLNPQLTNRAHQQIQKVRGRQGFATNLLMIAVDQKYNMPIRQSALVTLKNLIADQSSSESGGVMNRNDWQAIKASILQALIRSCGEKKLTPTIRQIIFKIAEKDYPERWTDIVPTILETFEKSQDLQRIFACVEALRAVASIYGRKILKQVSLNNLCNKIMIPLNKLSLYLFQNFNQASELILESIFKIFNTVIYFHLPEIIAANIHSWMIFLKKILDIPSSQMHVLKRICLKIMFRLYSTHFNKATKNTNFVYQFHERYTTPIFETLILQIFNQNQADKNKQLQMISWSLSCLPYIYNDHEKSAVILTNSLEKLILLCLQKFTLPENFSESSVTQFINFLHEQRSKFIDLIKLFLGQRQSEQSLNITNRVLSLLIEKIIKGSLEQKQITLYIFGQISIEIKYVPQIHQKMLQALLLYIIPLMKSNVSNKGDMIISARVCEIINSYEFINFPENEVQPICQKVYACLISENNSYLNVYACKAFTSLLRYESIVKYLVPFIGDILNNYVKLIEQVDLTDIQFLMEQMLQNFENHLGPYAGKLVKCFIQNFYKAHKSNDSATNPCQISNDDEYFGDQEAQDNQNTQKNYLAGVRQILLANLPQNCYAELQDDVFLLIVYIMRDSTQSFMQQGLNLLNIMLFKTNPENINQKYFHLYPVLIYSLTGIPPLLIEKQKSQQISLPTQFQEIITNLCVQSDADIIQNVIGSLRNYICKMGFNKNSLFRNKSDYLGNSFMSLALDAVQNVHGNANASVSDRSIMITIYITLLEYQCLDVNQKQLGRVLNLVTRGLQFQESTNQQAHFSPLYLQTIAVAAYYYEQYSLAYFNLDYFLAKLLRFWNKFRSDYQKQRIILGIGKLIKKQVFKKSNINSKLVYDVIKLLPKFLQEQCLDRNKQQVGQFCNRSESDQAIDQEQQNTHVMGISAPNTKMNQQQQGSEEEWETEYNKLYLSPTQKIEQIGFIGEVLQNQGRQFIEFLSNEDKHMLSNAITNVKPRN